MNTHLYDAAAELEALTDAASVWSATLIALAEAGIEIVLYLSSDPQRKSVTVLGNAPAIHADTPPSDDPFLEWCCNSYDINLTGVAFIDSYPDLPERARAFIRSAASHGFHSGIAIPMRLEGSVRFGGFNLGTGMDAAEFRTRIAPQREALRFFCLVAHRKLEEMGLDGSPSLEADAFRARLLAPASGALAILSPREREVIYLQAQGMARKQVAHLCGISPYTVAEYTAKAYRKLGINSRAQAARLVFGR